MRRLLSLSYVYVCECEFMNTSYVNRYCLLLYNLYEQLTRVDLSDTISMGV